MSVRHVSEIVFVGAGYRTTSFLGSAPDLLERDTTVIEASSRFGAGAFREYATTSSSIGSRFFANVKRQGICKALLEAPQVAAVARAEQPVELQELANALDTFGAGIRSHLGDRAILNRAVARIDVRGGKGVTVTLTDGQRLRARHCVLATGRHERPHPALRHHADRVVFSSQILCVRRRAVLYERIKQLEGGKVVIAGGSHSAFSALQVLMDIRAELSSRTSWRPFEVTVVHRSPIRVMYTPEERVRAEQDPQRGATFDARMHVCPKTGIVFRDTGLRHASRRLFEAVAAGRVPGASLLRVEHLDDPASRLAAADLVVQALGYRGRTPRIEVDGELVRDVDCDDPLTTDSTGQVTLPGHQPLACLSALRVEPTPPELRDNTAYGQGLYTDLARRLGQTEADTTGAHASQPHSLPV
ncbi:MAG TPA: FAD-dependent oxidoreductase [Solirubrobacteraceae bacterium]|nr:FAD-dependent oxidoreductase [Solirubrobacteraceae bacterium]